MAHSAPLTLTPAAPGEVRLWGHEPQYHRIRIYGSDCLLGRWRKRNGARFRRRSPPIASNRERASKNGGSHGEVNSFQPVGCRPRWRRNARSRVEPCIGVYAFWNIQTSSSLQASSTRSIIAATTAATARISPRICLSRWLRLSWRLRLSRRLRLPWRLWLSPLWIRRGGGDRRGGHRRSCGRRTVAPRCWINNYGVQVCN